MPAALRSRQPRSAQSWPRPEGFWARHFKPHGPVGALTLTVVIATICGVIGAVIYTNQDAREFRLTRDAEIAKEREAQQAAAAAAAEEERIRNLPPPLPSPEAVLKKVGGSVWKVETLDGLGRPSVGAAFVVGASGRQSLLLTSLSVVRALTVQPAPPLSVRNGDETLPATLWSWQDEWDLALIAVDGGIDQPEWAAVGTGAAGDKVYVVADGELVPGTLVGAGVSGFSQTVAASGSRAGAMLITAKGEVLGMLSRAFAPGAGAGEDGSFAVPVRAACERVLVCGPSFLPPADATPVAPSTTVKAAPATTSSTSPPG